MSTKPAPYLIVTQSVSPDLDALAAAATAADKRAGELGLVAFARETPEALRAYAEAEEAAGRAHAAHAEAMPRRTSKERQRAAVVALKAEAAARFAARARERAGELEGWS